MTRSNYLTAQRRKAAALLLALTILGVVSPTIKADDLSASSVRLRLAMPDAIADNGSPDRLEIAGDLTATYRGKNYLTVSQAVRSAVENGHAPVGIWVAGKASFGGVVDGLAEIENDPFEIWGNEKHRTFGKRDRPDAIAGPELTFRGSVEAYELPVVVHYSASAKACYASLSGYERNSQEFYDRAFVTLDNWVVSAGGIEQFVAATDNARNVVARIQARRNTPWRCVAGAIYHLRMAGFPAANLEVIEAAVSAR